MISRRLLMLGAAALKTGNTSLAAWVLRNSHDPEARSIAGLALSGGYAYRITSDADVATVNAAAATMAAGAKIGVQRGITLRTMLNLTANNLTVEAYGSGAQPLFDASNVVDPATWTKTAGLTNVYQTTIALDGGSKSLGNCWADDAFLTQVTSTALCDSTAGSAYVSDWTATSATLYVHTATGASPASDGHAYSYSSRWHGVKLTGTGCTVRGIKTRRSAHQDGSLVTYGENCTWDTCRIEDGARHASLAGCGLVALNCYWYRARNDLEAGQSANQLVVNQATVSGKSYSTTGCTFDGGDQPNVSALSNHGADNTALFASITHSSCTFINQAQCGDAHATTHTLDTCTFTNCVQGPYVGTNGATLLVKNCSGSVSTVFKNDTATGVTVTVQNNSWTPPICGTGVYRADSAGPSTGNTYNFTNETIYSTGATSGTGDVVRIADGAVNLSGLNVGPNLFGLKALHNLRLGFGGGTVTLTANDNHYPFGRDFIINGTTYATFALYQAGTTQDSRSDVNGTGGVGGSTSVFFADNFNRADENLEASANWTRNGGAAAQAGVRSNQLAMIGTTQTAYTCPDTTKTQLWVRGNVASLPGTPSSMPLAIIVDVNNWLALRWSAAQIQFEKCVAGTISQVGVVNTTVNVGDQLMLVKDGNVATVYVNGAVTIINGQSYAATTLDPATKAGTVARGSVLNPAIDNFEVGRAA